MEKANHKDFIGIISNPKPAMILFYREEEKAEAKKIKQFVVNLKKKFTLLPAYEFMIDESDENELLCNHIEVTQTPILMFFKDGCFNRYKSKGFTEKSISMFLGSKKQYLPIETKDESETKTEELEISKKVKVKTKKK